MGNDIKYIYIDESGDTGYTNKSTRYFIITAVVVCDSSVLKRIVKRVHKNILNKNKLNILHANKDNDSIKNKLIKELINKDILCIGAVLDKKIVYSQDLYIFGLEKICKYIKDKNINGNLFIARKDTRKSYNLKIINIVLKYCYNFSFSTPNKEKLIQIADFYSWCLFSKFEHESPEYFEKLSHHIIII